MILIKHPILLRFNIPRLYYSTNATLESTIQLRNKLYILPLPSHDQQQAKISSSDTTILQMDNREILELLSGDDAPSSISIHSPLFSVLLNKCLSDAMGNRRLRTVHAIESFYRIFEKYKREMTNNDYLCYYDLNRLCQYFIDCKQLGKSQKLLDYLFKKNPGSVHNNQFLLNYLNVRSGSDIKLWTLKKYKVLDYMVISQLTSKFNKIKYMSVPIIQSLGYMKNIPSLEQYLKSIWGVTLHDSYIQRDKNEKEEEEKFNTTHAMQLNKNDLLYPNEDLLLSIMLSYYYNSKTMVRSFQVLDAFLKKYPDIELTSKFWYNLVSNCLLLTSKKGRNTINSQTDDTNIIQIWNAMKLWYGDKSIPFNSEVLCRMYKNFKSNNNLYYINDVYERCIGPFSLSNSNLIPKQCEGTIRMYQRYIVRKNIDRRKYKRSREFIQKWSISLENKISLLQFYQTRTNIRKKKNRTPRKDEEEEEEDGILSLLW